MTVGTVVDPHILFAAEGHNGDRPEKDASRLLFASSKTTRTACEIGFVAIDQHQRPVAIGTMHRIGRHQQIAVTVFDVGGSGKH